MPNHDGPTVERRLAAMEVALSALIARVSRLEARVAPHSAVAEEEPPVAHPAPLAATSSPEPAFAPVPPLPRPTLHAPRSAPSLEQLLGRYGAIGFALVALLAGVGTFVSWAARQGLLGPQLRVAGGYLLAAALSVGGLRLRATRRTFSNALLACALAVTFAATWGAGPRLGLVPIPVALAIVALASAALAWLALREDENVLFLFGAAGAAIAPFVVGDEAGDPWMLAGYGALVYLAAARGVGKRPWRGAVRLVLWSVPAYLVTLASMTGGRALESSWAWAMPAFALGLWLASLLAAPMHAPRFVRWGAIGLLVAALDVQGHGPGAGAASVALALLATVGAQLLLARIDRLAAATIATAEEDPAVQLLPMLPRLSLERAYFDAVLLPVAGLVVAIAVTPEAWDAALAQGTPRLRAGGAMAALWALGAGAVASRHEGRGARSWPWTLTATLALAVGSASLADRPEALAEAGVYALAGALALAAWWRGRGPRRALTGAVGLLALATLYLAFQLADLAARESYAPPLTTRASLLAALVIASLLAVRAIVRGSYASDADDVVAGNGPRTVARALAVAAGVIGFLWGLAELEVAWSRDLSTMLGTLYVGVAGALAIQVGLRLRLELLRRVGLVLGGWCAVRTFLLAGSVESLALRVGLYFLAAGVGLAVAWMYTGGQRTIDNQQPTTDN